LVREVFLVNEVSEVRDDGSPVLKVETISFSPSETRRLLRERFGRSLATPPLERNQSRAISALPDEPVLALLLGLRIKFESDESTVRQAYDGSRGQHPEVPLSTVSSTPAGFVLPGAACRLGSRQRVR